MYRRKVALHTTSHLTPSEAWQSAVSTPWDGRRVSSEVPSDTGTRVFFGGKAGKVWRPCNLRSWSYKRLYPHAHTDTHTHTRRLIYTSKTHRIPRTFKGFPKVHECCSFRQMVGKIWTACGWRSRKNSTSHLLTCSNLPKPFHTSSHLFIPLHICSHLFIPVQSFALLFTHVNSCSHLFTR